MLSGCLTQQRGSLPVAWEAELFLMMQLTASKGRKRGIDGEVTWKRIRKQIKMSSANKRPRALSDTEACSADIFRT